jgi:hypothetical protein
LQQKIVYFSKLRQGLERGSVDSYGVGIWQEEATAAGR